MQRKYRTVKWVLIAKGIRDAGFSRGEGRGRKGKERDGWKKEYGGIGSSSRRIEEEDKASVCVCEKGIVMCSKPEKEKVYGKGWVA